LSSAEAELIMGDVDLSNPYTRLLRLDEAEAMRYTRRLYTL
jgi:hypothetical protein